MYLETKFAALASYGLSVQLLQEVLPIGTTLNTMSLRRQVRHTAERLESERGSPPADLRAPDRPQARETLPEPAVPVVVGLDGVYVHAKDQRSRTEGWFEVIVGKRLATEDRASKCFGFVSRYEPLAQRASLGLAQRPRPPKQPGDHVSVGRGRDGP